jgi:hypothetical protein
MNDKMRKVIAKRNSKSYANMVANPPKKKKMSLSKIFEKQPKNSHLMSDGKTIMSGSKHNKTSKVIGKLKKKKKKVAKY